MLFTRGGLDNPLACRRAANYTKNCVNLGYPYIVWDDMKESVELLYFEKTQKHMIRKIFEMKRKESEVAENHKVDGPETPEKAENQEQAVEPALPAQGRGIQRKQLPPAKGAPLKRLKSSAQLGEEAGRGPAPTGTKRQSSRGKAGKSQLCQDVVDAEDLKMKYHQCMGLQSILISAISTDQSYQWALTESKELAPYQANNLFSKV